MPVFRLTDEIAFPSPDLAEDSGLLAVGGDLRPQRLLVAYALGIFPWYQEGGPILWHAPDPRMVLLPRDLHVSRSLAKVMRRGEYTVTFDTAFAEVIARCAKVPREDQDGTWITREMQDAYTELHQLGYAHSAEAWHDGELVGGLYGVSLGRAFFGESMFATRSNASKVAFVTLVRWLERWPVDFVDCQVYTEHLEQFGATEWPRRKFSAALDSALEHPSRVGKWSLEE